MHSIMATGHEKIRPYLFLVSLALLLGTVRGFQVIRLRHPESFISNNLLFNPSLPSTLQQNRGQGQTEASRPDPRPSSGTFTNDRPSNQFFHASQQAAQRRRPRPGNVLVRFDSNHEIERVQYVLQDGQLATIYTRRSDTGPQPVEQQQQQQQQASNQQPPLELKQPVAQVQPETVSTEPPVSQSDNHHQLTFESHELEDEWDQHQPAIEGPHQQNQHLQEKPSGGAAGLNRPQSETSDILATIAHDAIAAQGPQVQAALAKMPPAGEKLRKFGGFLGKLKKKIKAKLSTLPHFVQTKLNAKSSNGQLFVDQASGERTPIQLQSDQHQEMLNNPIGLLRLRQQAQQQMNDQIGTHQQLRSE